MWALGFLRGPDKKNWAHYQEVFGKGKAVFIARTDTTCGDGLLHKRGRERGGGRGGEAGEGRSKRSSN